MDWGWVTRPQVEYQVKYKKLGEFLSIKIEFLPKSGNKSLYMWKFLIEMCMMIWIQDLEGVQKKCLPKEDQHKKIAWVISSLLDLKTCRVPKAGWNTQHWTNLPCTAHATDRNLSYSVNSPPPKKIFVWNVKVGTLFRTLIKISTLKSSQTLYEFFFFCKSKICQRQLF